MPQLCLNLAFVLPSLLSNEGALTSQRKDPEMLSASTFKFVNYLLAGVLTVALCGSAKAAVGSVAHTETAITRPTATPVYWIWRHHHRIWVPNHHHY